MSTLCVKFRRILVTSSFIFLCWAVVSEATCSSDGFCNSDDLSKQSPTADTILRFRCVYGGTDSNQSLISYCCKISFNVLTSAGNQLTWSSANNYVPSMVSQQKVNSSAIGIVAGTTIDVYSYTIQPAKAQTNIADLSASSLPTLCLTVSGTTSGQRCLKIFIVTDPYEVVIPGYFKASPDWQPRPSQAPTVLKLQSGVTYTFIVVAKHQFAEDRLSIELRGRECSVGAAPDAPPCPSPELPNMKWLNPTSCFNNATPGICSFTNAGALRQTCTDARPYNCLSYTGTGSSPDQRNWNWYRMFQYTPRGVEVGNFYQIAFQAFASGYFSGSDANQNGNVRSFGGLSFTPPSVSNGATGVSNVYQCQGDVISFAETQSYLVPPVYGYHQIQIVQRDSFGFDYNQQMQMLYTAGGLPFTPPLVSALPIDPETTVTLYMNCPTRIGYYSKQPDSSIFEVSGLNDLAGMKISTDMLYPCGSGTFCPYAEISWTAPPSFAGRTAQLCLRAQTIGDASSFQDSCAIYQVARCIVCSRAGDSLKSISAYFKSNWLQIWSVNDNNLNNLLSQELYYNKTGSRSGGERGVSFWKSAKNPVEVQPGQLVRIGPIFETRLSFTVDRLIAQFQTTEESLRAANTDLDPSSNKIQSGQELCILPQFCQDSNAY